MRGRYCGNAIPQTANFCAECGAPAVRAEPPERLSLRPRMDVFFLSVVATLAITLVRGNHDRHAGPAPDDWRVVEHAGPLEIGPFLLRHEPAPVGGRLALPDHRQGVGALDPLRADAAGGH